jgi:hypothetical protein
MEKVKDLLAAHADFNFVISEAIKEIEETRPNEKGRVLLNRLDGFRKAAAFFVRNGDVLMSDIAKEFLGDEA